MEEKRLVGIFDFGAVYGDSDNLGEDLDKFRLIYNFFYTDEPYDCYKIESTLIGEDEEGNFIFNNRYSLIEPSLITEDDDIIYTKANSNPVNFEIESIDCEDEEINEEIEGYELVGKLRSLTEEQRSSKEFIEFVENYNQHDPMYFNSVLRLKEVPKDIEIEIREYEASFHEFIEQKHITINWYD